MPDPRRHALLDAMGIEVWVERHAAGGVTDDASEPLATWAELRARVATCEACGLHRGRSQTVFGSGAENASCMVIGEAPGAEEDKRGEPFVGRAGMLLTSMLSAIGFTREEVFIANIVKCRPPQNRDPEPIEAAACKTFLTRQIELINPTLILALGRVAAQNLLQSDVPIGRMRGQVYRYGESRIPVLVTYHPAYLLRSPREKRKVWQDLQGAKNMLGAPSD